jgi:dihydroxy-acid dehydratase
MADNWRSRLITHGIARSPNRAMLRAVGFGDADFEKPIVGVANGHSNMNPCNAGIQPLVDRAMAALKDAGAMPQVFGTPTITDGIGMGTEGMKYSLVSREVIADSIEVAVNGQMMDGVLCVGGCDKNMPGAMMALARMNVPGIFVYAGTIKPGMWKGQALTIVSPFEAVGAFMAGKMSKEDFDGIEKNACPSVGACGGMYTANTMSSSFEALGMSLLGSSQMASPDSEKADSSAASAKVLVNAIHNNIRPRDIITRKSIENAISLVMATGGSTNAVLHYLAIASAAEVPWTIDDFERIRQKVPVLCDLKPSGRYVAVDFHRAGGVPQVLKVLLKHGLLHGDCLTITGKTLAEELEAAGHPRRLAVGLRFDDLPSIGRAQEAMDRVCAPHVAEFHVEDVLLPVRIEGLGIEAIRPRSQKRNARQSRPALERGEIRIGKMQNLLPLDLHLKRYVADRRHDRHDGLPSRVLELNHAVILANGVRSLGERGRASDRQPADTRHCDEAGDASRDAVHSGSAKLKSMLPAEMATYCRPLTA